MPRRNDLRPLVLPLALAAVLTGLNAAKPPCIDDPAYLAVARQIAADPLDPYGFEQFWYQEPQPANEVLAPPVLPYWLGLGMRLFGERPVLLKVWLLPVALVLALALMSLLRRFARGVEAPALVGIVLSPAVLPGFNFMLDVPALALALAAVALFLRGLDRDSLRLVIFAGLVAGLAAQTKYTGALACPVLLAAALLRRRAACGLVATSMAAAICVAWELFTRWRYGESHFLVALQDSSTTLAEKLAMPLWGVEVLGAVGAPLVLWAVAALWRRPGPVLLGAAMIAASLAVVALVPDTRGSVWVDSEPHRRPGVTTWLFQSWGTIVLVLLALAIVRVAMRRRWRRRFREPFLLLMAWLAVEAIGFEAMTNFIAARRVLGFAVVASLLLAHVASRTCRGRRGRVGLWFASLAGATVGLLFTGIDLADSRLEPRAIRLAAEHVERAGPGAPVWFTGHWGTQYEAERRGFRAVVPGRSVLRAGDWLIDAPAWVTKQRFRPDERMGAPVHVVSLDRALRLRTLPSYYGGDRPIEWWPPPMIEVRVYRVRATWVPAPE